LANLTFSKAWLGERGHLVAVRVHVLKGLKELELEFQTGALLPIRILIKVKL